MKLHYAPGACSLAPHIALLEADLAFELKPVDFGPDYLVTNPKGLVPALELANGEVLTECIAILLYIADTGRGELLAASGTPAYYRTVEWLSYIASELQKGYGNPRHSDETQPKIQERLSTRFDFVNEQLQGRDFLVGDRCSIADIYLYVVGRWKPMIGLDSARWPALAAHAERMAARPAVARALEAEGLTGS